MAIRTLSEIIQSAIDFIKTKRPDIATFTGTVTRDVVIESPAQEFDNVYQELSRTQQLQSVVFAENMEEEELEALAFNYGIQRLGGTTSSGTITFRIRNFTVSSSDVLAPVGTVVSTQGANAIPQISFVTTSAILFQAALAPTYFNPDTGFYELTASITAQAIGETGNVAANTITNLTSQVASISEIANTVATTGGTNEETNAELGSRIQTKLAGNNIGTPAGIRNLVQENENVDDSIIVTPNDPEMERAEFGGEVDIYILGEILTTITDTILYQAAGAQEFILQHQPVRSVSSVTGIASAVPITFVEGVDYNVVFDTSTLLNGSIRLETKIEFDIGGTNPDDASSLSMEYVYNSLIEILQLELDKDENHIVTSDNLVKEATEASIDITADVALFPGNIEADSIADIQTALSEHINNLGLGDSIDRSDIVGVIEGVDSVDQINLNTLELAKDGTPLPQVDQRLTILKTEFPRVGVIVINIV